MGLAQKIVSSVRALRNDKQIKVRQPLSRIIIFTPDHQLNNAIEKMSGIICEEVNVKSIEFVENEDILVSKTAKPNFKILGAKVGKMMGQMTGIIKSFNAAQIKELEQQGNTNVYIDSHEIHLELDDVEIISQPKENMAVHSESGLTVALDLALSEQLIEEGVAREFVNRVQNLRKEAGFEVMDHIQIEVEKLDSGLEKAIKNQQNYICTETLADQIVYGNVNQTFNREVVIDNHKFIVGLFKNN
jgi:isoleucyl-tRNA synthetase